MGLARTLGPRLGRASTATSGAHRRGGRSPTAARSSGPRAMRSSPGSRRPSPPSRPPSRSSEPSRPRPGRPGSRSASGSGLHTGEAHRSGDDYGGFDVNRAARVAAVGHGGQVVLSETTAALVADALPAGTTLRDLGRHVLKDVPRAERLSQLDIAGLPCEFPPLRTAAERVGNLPDRLTSFIGRDEERRRARDARAGRAAGDADRSGRHRQDEPGDRDGPGARSASSGTARGS